MLLEATMATSGGDFLSACDFLPVLLKMILQI